MALDVGAARLPWSFSMPRSGAGYWWSSFRTMLRWDVASLRLDLPIVVIIQLIAGAGIVVMMSLLVPGDPPRAAVEYLAAGVPVVNLYLLGLVFGPQWIAEQRAADSYDATRVLPCPRSASLAAWYAVTLAAGVPGMLGTLVVAAWRYHIDFTVSPMILPAVLLVAVSGTMIGAAIGHGVGEPMISRIGVQAINMFVVGFTPTLFPVDRLPDWLQAINVVLPFEHMSALLRATLTAGPVDDLGLSCLVVVAWSAACAGLAAWAMGRRG
ncbi:MAG TPA: ABC transporter permease [Candidatus Sulfotelmatobacter sp.]|nr:ABC transporter permease [Candidatus Sulfotelmatobacter sp.]